MSARTTPETVTDEQIRALVGVTPHLTHVALTISQRNFREKAKALEGAGFPDLAAHMLECAESLESVRRVIARAECARVIAEAEAQAEGEVRS